MSDPDRAKHPKGRSIDRAQAPVPKSQVLASRGIASFESPCTATRLQIVAPGLERGQPCSSCNRGGPMSSYTKLTAQPGPNGVDLRKEMLV
jgi:hypothetical protein